MWITAVKGSGSTETGRESSNDATQASDSRKRAGKVTHTPKEAEWGLLGAGEGQRQEERWP